MKFEVPAGSRALLDSFSTVGTEESIFHHEDVVEPSPALLREFTESLVRKQKKNVTPTLIREDGAVGNQTMSYLRNITVNDENSTVLIAKIIIINKQNHLYKTKE